ELATAFAVDQEQLNDDQFGIVPVDPSKSLRATGLMPMLVHGNSRRDECQKVLSIVAALLHSGGVSDGRFPQPLSPSEIGILYPWIASKENPLLTEFIKGLERLAPVVWLQGENRSRVSEPGIKVQTIHGSKGLQYRAVILLWADRLPRTFPDTDPCE